MRSNDLQAGASDVRPCLHQPIALGPTMSDTRYAALSLSSATCDSGRDGTYARLRKLKPALRLSLRARFSSSSPRWLSLPGLLLAV